MTGLVLQCIGGFYYVEAADGIYTCRARGSLRQKGISPLTGDRVTLTPAEEMTGTVDAVLPRKNSFIRPPVANLDCFVLVVSLTDPSPNLLVIDRLIASAEYRHVEPVLVFSKTDLESPLPLLSLYRSAGFTPFTVCEKDPDSVLPLKENLKGKICAFAGNSGAGKSTLLNLLDPSLRLKVGETSRKLGRGRHTTRSVRLYPQPGGGYIADTPGFSSLDPERLQHIPQEDLVYCFREWIPYLGKCRFASCSHSGEKGCAVAEAVTSGTIARSRYDSYLTMVREAQEWKAWREK